MYIYKITNNLNNKIYIGLKTSTVEESESYYGSGTVIKAAIKKHGIDNFTKTILERDIVDYDYLQERERHYIKLYDSQKNGYNRTEGGNGVIGWKIDDGYRQKISNSSSNRKWYHCPITKKNVFVKEKPEGYVEGRCFSEEALNKMANRKGKVHTYTEEQKQKISKALTGRKLSKEHIEAMAKGHRGKILSEEHKEKIRQGNLGLHKNYTNVKCPHCGLEGKGPNMTRYHFDNCKQKS